MRTLSASAILLLLGVSAVWGITEGFEVLTSEQARRRTVLHKQPAVPAVRLINQAGRAFRLEEWVRENHRLIIVDFIYTNCQSLCRSLGSEFQQLQHGIVERNLQNRVHLLSVSFDPQHDNPTVLRQYAEHMQARHDVWTFATVEDAKSLDTLLSTFGVTVIPDQQGGFQHNAALVWVAPSGRLLRVTDYAATESLQALDELAGS